MVFEGYARFGGTEIVNSERVRGYSDTSDCPPNWFIGPRCESLRDALQDGPYTAGNIANAPWFDGALADLSGRFHGVYGLKFANMENSTRSAPTTEGIADGGTIGRTRKGVREVRITATLVAHGRDALEYGISWLNSAIDPGSCGQHGTACGTTDFEYLTECPPARGTVEELGDWTAVEENLALNPRFESNLNIPVGSVRSSDWSASGTYSIFVPGTTGYGHGPYGHTTYGRGPEEEI